MAQYITGTWDAYLTAQQHWAAHYPNCTDCDGPVNTCPDGRRLREMSRTAYEHHWRRGTRDTRRGLVRAAACRGARRMMTRWSAERLREQIKLYEYLTTDERVRMLRGPLGQEFSRHDIEYLRMLRNALKFRLLDGGKRRIWRCDFCGKNLVPISGRTALLRCGDCKDR
jgi:hypothetical protein